VPRTAPKAAPAPPPPPPMRPPPTPAPRTSARPLAQAAGGAEAGPVVRLERPNPAPQPGERPVVMRALHVVDQLRSAQDRDQVGHAMLNFVATLYHRAAFLVIKKGALNCFASRGALPAEALRALTIPLDAPSLLQEVVAECSPWRGALPPGPINTLLANALGGWPSEIILVPVRIRERVIGVIYVDGPRVSVPDGTLEKLAVEAGTAYERILRAHKDPTGPLRTLP